MNGALRRASGVRHLSVLLALFLSFLIASCGGQPPSGGSQPKPVRPTPPPPFKERVERVRRDVLLRYATSLNYDTVAAVGDQQRLMIGKCPDDCRYGPLVDIQPEFGAAFLTTKTLGEGRIVGRFVNLGQAPYEKLAIPAGQVSYV